MSVRQWMLFVSMTGACCLMAGLACAETKSSAGSKAKDAKPRAAAGSPAVHSSGGWPQFLGPDRNNVSREMGLLNKWPENGPRLLWTARGLGAGYTPVSVRDNTLFTMGNRGEDEFLLALKLEGGGKLWEVRTGRAFHEGAGDGPRSTPTVDGDSVYALGASGDLCCTDARSGKVSWRKNILADFGAHNITWGICESVLIDGERLICTPGGPAATLVALDKKIGKLIWKSAVPGGPSAAYGSAVAIDVGGVRQYAQVTGAGIVGVRASDGKFLWADNHANAGGTNCSSPVFDDGFVFSSSGYGIGGALLKLTSRDGQTTAEFIYHTTDMKSHHGGYLVIDGYLYGSNDPGILTCIELKTGKVKWQDRSVGKGAITAADGKLILRSEQGPVALVQATPAGYRELGRFNPPERSKQPTWPYPLVAYGKLFLRDQDFLQCYDLKGK